MVTNVTTSNDISRRTVLGLLLGGVALAVLPASKAHAMSTADAQGLVNALVNDINKVIASGKSESAMYREFEKIFLRYADVPTIAQYSLGSAARSASRAQLNAYTKAFTGYISRKYGKRFREFIGGRLEVTGAKPVKSFVEVSTTAHLRGEDPFAVTFLVSDRSGKSKFFNLFIEGVNMLLTERTEIGSMLDRRGGNIDALTRDLQSMS
ncbi:phospholipid transport system substrate-binding protein [Tropicimonas isoalkanivorans]|uniref:Phospholipid transport system substrate-binding protein n=1 Tax=Tropicimonas isoalkanivorans TaxID=441112 RepID=A0A1I1NXA8_9RHOB|nr:phospholipid transport system substrate-binding protein [Tropicimonas isoalkanivorans]